MVCRLLSGSDLDRTELAELSAYPVATAVPGSVPVSCAWRVARPVIPGARRQVPALQLVRTRNANTCRAEAPLRNVSSAITRRLRTGGPTVVHSIIPVAHPSAEEKRYINKKVRTHESHKDARLELGKKR